MPFSSQRFPYAGTAFLPPQSTLLHKMSQNLKIPRHHSQRHIAGETVQSVIWTAVESMVFQGMNPRFDRGMLLTSPDKLFRELPFPISL